MNTEAPDENDDLWELLGKARAPQVSPFFARNVLRTIREETPALQQETPALRAWFLAWLHRQWRVASLGIAVGTAALLLFTTAQKPTETQDQVITLAQQVSVSPDYEVIAHLDELLASEESSVWLDNSVQ